MVSQTLVSASLAVTNVKTIAVRRSWYVGNARQKTFPSLERRDKQDGNLGARALHRKQVTWSGSKAFIIPYRTVRSLQVRQQSFIQNQEHKKPCIPHLKPAAP
jgi:hypothetical protein